VLGGATVEGGRVELTSLLSAFPVAVLARTGD
jgi:hypothetical protein